MRESFSVVAPSGLSDFFSQEIRRAANEIPVSVSNHTVEYTAGVLTRFYKTSEIQHYIPFTTARPTRDRYMPDLGPFVTLTEMYMRVAKTGGPRERKQARLNLGEISLVIAGVVASDLTRKIKLYIDMGRNSYEVLGRAGDADSSIYEEVAAKFVGLVDIINFMTEKQHAGGDFDLRKSGPTDLRRLIEQYNMTGSLRAKKMAERILHKAAGRKITLTRMGDDYELTH